MASKTTYKALSDELLALLGPARLVTSGPDLKFYGRDRGQGGWDVRAAMIAFPESVEEIQSIVRACAANDVAIVPSGGRTGLAGAATATRGELVLSLSRMNRVLALDKPARTMRCQAGVTIEQVQTAAAEVGLLYPVDYAAKGSAHIAGSVATNAGGVRVVRYGLTRDWIAGMRVVLASGEALELGGGLVKNNTGYDLRQLFIGSEGTLGIIAEVTVKLCAPPAGTLVALCAVPSDAAVGELFARVRSRGELVISAFECLDHGCIERVLEHRGSEAAPPFAESSPHYVLIEAEVPHSADFDGARERVQSELIACLGDAAEAEEIDDAQFASTAAQARALWALREDIGESLHPHRPHKADVALPIARVAEFATAWRALVSERLPEIEALCFGHVGDGNLHLNLLCPRGSDHAAFLERCHAYDAELYALVERFAGSVSAEHGIGLLKRDYLHHTRGPEELALMRSIKAAFDPRGLLNPGKIFRD